MKFNDFLKNRETLVLDEAVITDPKQLEKEFGDLVALLKDERKDHYYSTEFKDLSPNKRKQLVKVISALSTELMKI